MEFQFPLGSGTGRMNKKHFLVSDENYLTNHSVVEPSMVQNHHQQDITAEDAISSCIPHGSPSPFYSEEYQCLNFPAITSQLPYCTLEPSLGAAGQSLCSSSSTHDLYSTGSPVSQQDSQTYPPDVHHSPENTFASTGSRPCSQEEENEWKLKLREFEIAMLEPDLESGNDSVVTLQNMFGWETCNQMLEIKKGGVKQLLIASANALANNNLKLAKWFMDELQQMVSVSGEPIERLGAYMLEGLRARLNSSGNNIYKALKCKEPTNTDLLSYMHTLYEICPYFKFGYMSANGAIAEALKGEDRVHIIDFQIAQGSQWVPVIKALAESPRGPPHVRITGVDDSQSFYARAESPQSVGKRLSKVAESCGVPLEFNAVAMSGSDVELHMFKIQPNETLAVNFPFQLHHMPDESVSTTNHRDRLLRLVKSLSPKVVTLVEQECNTNTAPFFARFMEALSYYTAMFESIDLTLPRDNKKRISTEQHCLAREIVNIIACEGAERVERHELLDKWKSRFMMAGFRPYPLSPLVNSTIKSLLQSYCEHYTLEERDGALYLGWKTRALVASCAWC